MADDATPTMSITPFFDAKPSQPPSFRPESHPKASPALLLPTRFTATPPSRSSNCFPFRDLSPASQPASKQAWTIFTTTMMRSLATIFPGFLPPVAVINATIPCHQKGKRSARVQGGKLRVENSPRGSSTRGGHCWRARNSVKCLRKLR